jgi:predicted nucleic acid-binding protein
VTKLVLDTNIYIDWLNRGPREEHLIGRGVIRYLSAVVQMELRMGTRTAQARRALDQLFSAYRAGGRIITPSPAIYDDAGQVLQQLSDAGREVRRAALVHDVLIALSARSIGATLITANPGDFVAIRKLTDFSLQVA